MADNSRPPRYTKRCCCARSIMEAFLLCRRIICRRNDTSRVSFVRYSFLSTKKIRSLKWSHCCWHNGCPLCYEQLRLSLGRYTEHTKEMLPLVSLWSILLLQGFARISTCAVIYTTVYIHSRCSDTANVLDLCRLYSNKYLIFDIAIFNNRWKFDEMTGAEFCIGQQMVLYVRLYDGCRRMSAFNIIFQRCRVTATRIGSC